MQQLQAGGIDIYIGYSAEDMGFASRSVWFGLRCCPWRRPHCLIVGCIVFALVVLFDLAVQPRGFATNLLTWRRAGDIRLGKQLRVLGIQHY